MSLCVELPLVAERVPRDAWEWYSLMQHYRAPTRLLDWTDSALVAFYFALTSYKPSSPANIHPVVWALNPWTLNRWDKNQDGSPPGTDWDITQKYLPPPYSGNLNSQWRSIQTMLRNECWFSTVTLLFTEVIHAASKR